MRIEPAFKNRVLFLDNDFRVEFSRGKLLFRNDEGKLVRKFAVNTDAIKKILAGFSLTERLLRLEPRTVIRMNKSLFLIPYNGFMQSIDLITGEVKEIFRFFEGTKNPLCFCQYTRNGANEVVFGDYGGHDCNGNIGIFRFAESKVRQIGSIKAGSVNHIHRVEYDSFRDLYWIFTGDSDEGSGIWQMEYDSGEVKPFLVGSQEYRACVAYVGEKDMIYATDSPINKNRLYNLDIVTKELTPLFDLPGSCIYGYKNEKWNQLVLATAVEPDSLLPRWRYLITRRLGSGIRDHYCHVFTGNPEVGFEEIVRLKKDILPMLLFQFGNVRFPNQNATDKVYFCPQATKLLKACFRTYVIDFSL